MTTKNLHLVRGVSGSGKTTFATTLAEKLEAPVLSADQYFEGPDGSYNFNPSKLKTAHEWCRTQTENYMKGGQRDVFVANTFTQEWEMENYFKLAEEYGYQVFTLIVENRHGSKDVHNVPSESIKKMKDRFEVVL